MVPAYYATISRAERPIDEPVTKIGGRPVLIQPAEWPACAWCGRALELWCQVRLDEPLRVSDTYAMAYVYGCPAEQDPWLEPRCPTRDLPLRGGDQVATVLLQRAVVAPYSPDGPAAFPRLRGHIRAPRRAGRRRCHLRRQVAPRRGW
jgi:hypothetical protein